MKGDDIAKRLLSFAVRVLEVARRLPRDSVGRHVGMQLLRAATSGGANYEEARRAESRADFAHKIGIAAKELGESRYWLRLVVEANLVSAPWVDQLMKEADELIAILAASAKTARSRS